MHRCVWQLLLLAAAHLCSQTISSSTASKTGLTLQQRLETIAKYKRSINGRRELITSTTSIYSQTSMEIAENLYDSLYRKIIHGKSQTVFDQEKGFASSKRRHFFTKICDNFRCL